MKGLFAAMAGLTVAGALLAAPARGAEATFERTLAVNGRVDLTASTGSGSIQLTHGPDGHIHVLGRVRSNWGGSEEQVKEIVAHPPIEQSGNIVRIGAHHENLHNVSIDYEIEAPANAYLDATTGSGNITDDGVGSNARLGTGSGNIHATGLQGSFSLSDGSGSIYAEQVGKGDVRAETGSGSIELRNLDGGLHARTGSGSIKAGGKPDGPWRLSTGSGSVEAWTGGAGLDLDAESGSGSIRSDRNIETRGQMGRHHLTGKIDGGGPIVRIETGSGNIRIH
jgi:hypothetical protein